MKTRHLLPLLLTGCIPLFSGAAEPSPLPVSTASVSAPAFKHPPGSFVTVNGVKLWCESVGSGEPVLLIAGGPGCSHSYLHPQLDALATTHRVIYFDALGRGRSDRAKDPAEYTLGREVSDVVELIRGLKLGPLTVLGHSYGTVVAQALALQHPECLKRLVLVAPYHSAEMWKASTDRYFLQCQQTYPEEWADLMRLRARGLPANAPECRALWDRMPVWLTDGYFDGSNDAKIADIFEVEYAVFDTMTGGNSWETDLGGTLAGYDFRDKLKQIAVPTLVLAGRADGNAMPAYTRQYRQLMPQAEFVMLERSGHGLFLEEPEKALATLRAFLAR